MLKIVMKNDAYLFNKKNKETLVSFNIHRI